MIRCKILMTLKFLFATGARTPSTVCMHESIQCETPAHGSALGCFFTGDTSSVGEAEGSPDVVESMRL